MEIVKPIDGIKLYKCMEEVTRYTPADIYSEQYKRNIAVVALKCIKEAPAIDYVPVIHAHWIEEEIVGARKLTCSHCNSNLYASDDWNVPYCWQCGAKMDEESEDK